MPNKKIAIGGASGYWGDASHATAQLLKHDGLEYISYDYLAEITMSIMARARMKDATKGYALDFVTEAMAPNLKAIAEHKVKVLSNAGGLNPAACAEALREVIAKQGLDLKVGVVEGDDLAARTSEFAEVKEMQTGESFPGGLIASSNAYLGAFPIAAALNAGADIVITGRCVDSALPLGACIHAYGWTPEDLDKLAGGSLAGHIIECGVQTCGGNFTDWMLVDDITDMGYPIVDVSEDGSFDVYKPANTSGLVCRGTVGEQMLYEIGDPQSYFLPDVVCDFSEVALTDIAENRVNVKGAKGRTPTGQYKVSTTYLDGFRAGAMYQFNGVKAGEKAKRFVNMGIERARRKLRAMNAADYTETCIEVEGGRPGDGPYEEVTVKVAVRHDDARAVGLFLKETMGGALASPAGLSGFTGGGRAKPSPVVRLFSFLIDAEKVPVTVTVDGMAVTDGFTSPALNGEGAPALHDAPGVDGGESASHSVPLELLAYGRSGDKGDNANIGILAREPEYFPWIWASLTEDVIKSVFGSKLKGDLERFYLPGSHSMNILMTHVLGGGGVVSLRNDSQGKGFAQRLLSVPIAVPETIARKATEQAQQEELNAFHQ